MRVGIVKRAAFGSLFLGRIVYAVNWFNLAAVFSLIASELNQDVSGLGLVTATFYLGIGIFQVPGGILAAKIGPRMTVTYGTTIASLAALLTSLSTNLAEIATLRFFVGLGMALVFAPGVTLVMRSMQRGSSGLGVGLYNSAFSLGGAIGLSGWAVLAARIGWRSSLVLSGAIGLPTVVLLLISTSPESQRSDFKVDIRRLKPILLNKWLVAMGVAMLGIGVGGMVVGNFMTYYLENVTHINVGEAGTIASLVSLFALVTAPLSGRMFDKSGNAKKLLFSSGALMTFGVGIAFVGTVYSAILSCVLVGLASGAGFTFAFSAARETSKLDPEYETLAISWVNSISLFGQFGPPLLFSHLVIQYGYPPAWLCLAVLTFILMVPVLFTKVPRQKLTGDY
jgi:MFS family permease